MKHRTLAEVERDYIREVLQFSRWNMSKASRILGIDRCTLYRKMPREELKRARLEALQREVNG